MDYQSLILSLVLITLVSVECQRFTYPQYLHSGPYRQSAESYEFAKLHWPGANLIKSLGATQFGPQPPAPIAKPPAIILKPDQKLKPNKTEPQPAKLEEGEVSEEAVLSNEFPLPSGPFMMPAPPVEETRTTLEGEVEETEEEEYEEYEEEPNIMTFGEVPPSIQDSRSSLSQESGFLPAVPIPLLIREPHKIEQPVDCDMNRWTPWSACTVSCNGGEQARSRSVKVLPVRGGLPCPESYQDRHCNTQSCPLPNDCQLVNWTPWTACSRQCGGGIQARSRAVIQQAQLGGKPCEPTYQEQSCHTHDCPKRQKCVLDPWSPWSSCSQMCGGGVQARSRTILTPPAPEAPECGRTHETRDCNGLPCPENCVLSLWEAWSPCTRSCGGGEKARKRIVLRHGTEGGRQCPQTLEEVTQCSLQQCPVDCELGEWEAWTRCSSTCGGGLRLRSRRILRDSIAGGTACPFRDALKDTQTCNNEQCPVDCKLSGWSPWTDCSAECGGGLKLRERSILQTSQFGGKNCPAESMLKQSIQCNPHPCPLDCRLNDWEPWSSCSRTCGGGERYRRRLVLQPPYAGGKECPPASQLRESELCSTNMCPVDCVVGQWGHWSQCSNCGGGVRSRWRPIIRENAAGGFECPQPSDLQTVEECFEECPEPEVVVVRQPIVVRQKETQVVSQPVIVRQPVVKVTQRQPITGRRTGSEDESGIAQESSIDEELARDRPRLNTNQARSNLNGLREAAQNRVAAVQRARNTRRRSSRLSTQRGNRRRNN